jgi:hypothetical protein
MQVSVIFEDGDDNTVAGRRVSSYMQEFSALLGYYAM